MQVQNERFQKFVGAVAPVLTRPLKRSQYSKYLYSLTLNFKNHNEIPTKINHYKFLSKFSQVFLSRFMLPFKSIMRFKHFWTCLSPIFSNKRIRQKRLLREELLVFWSIREQLLVFWKNIYPWMILQILFNLLSRKCSPIQKIHILQLAL